MDWSWIVREAWRHCLATDPAVREPWPVPSETLAIDGYQVVPLRCVADLREEAEAMRNCLVSLEDACREGSLAAYSIRREGQRLANFTVSPEGGEKPSWALEDVMGRSNTAVPDLQGLAARACEVLIR